jgi:hypothetical protein
VLLDYGPVLLIVLGALPFYLLNNDFPLGLHMDEPRKVDFLMGDMYYMHPALMIWLSKVGSSLVGATTHQELVVAGRTVQAILAGASIFVLFAVGRRVLSRGGAHLACLAFAASPILVLHAHYLKEDVLFTLTMLLSLAAFLRYLENRTGLNAVLVGLATGLAMSSKYAGVILFVFYALYAWRSFETNRFGWLRRVGVVAGAVFIILNAHIFLHPTAFLEDFGFEINHAFDGHVLRIWFFEHLFTYHFTQHIMPGLTPNVALAGLAGMLWVLMRRENGPLDNAVLLFAVVYYLVVEMSPTKPWVNSIRYVLPAAPILCIYFARLVQGLSERIPAKAVASLLVPIAATLFVAYQFVDSVKVAQAIGHDSRFEARALASRLDGEVLWGIYSAPKWDSPTFTGYDPTVGNWPPEPYVATASNFYGRYLYGRNLIGQKSKVERMARRYELLFQCPYYQINPVHRTMGFSDPTIRIVRIADCPAVESSRKRLADPGGGDSTIGDESIYIMENVTKP